MKDKEILYLKAKYYYYIVGEPIMLDSKFDQLEEELKRLNSKVVDFVDFPSEKDLKNAGYKLSDIVPKVKRDEVKYDHPTPMLSLEKIQVNNEEKFPTSKVSNFLKRMFNEEGFECSLKYDGNGIELIYKGKELKQGLTRGDKTKGLDKTDKLKYIVPNEIPVNDNLTYQIRGELVIDVKLWDKKYNNPEPGKISNPRNFIAGILTREEINLDVFNDLVFVAYDLVSIDENNNVIHLENTMETLKKWGFNSKYNPETIKIYSYDDFEDMYFKMKKLRKESNYLIDGIVIKYPEKYRSKMGATVKYPKWAVAIKFPSEEVQTTINDIEWTMGKNRELTPVAILEPVELLGTIVKRASLSNLGNIFKNKIYPGSVVSIKKSGEIIPMITSVISRSDNEKEYDEQIEKIINK